MDPEEIRPRMRVTVNEDINLTKQMWGAESEMHFMAGNGRSYQVSDVKSGVSRVGRTRKDIYVNVAGYMFAPQDLTLYEPDEPADVNIKANRKKVTFDPANL